MFQLSSRWAPAALFALTAVALGGRAAAQQEAPPTVTIPYEVDSGPAENLLPSPQVVLSIPVIVEGAEWVRLYFDEVELAGDLFAGTGSILRLTALADGGIQELDVRHLAEWQNSSAYFNGDTVLVEVLAQPGTGMNRVRMRAVDYGLVPSFTETICGANDDRVLSNDPRSARILPIGCTGWLIDDCKQCFLTAGHCGGGVSVVQFNVPLSNSGGGLNQPSPDDQYAVDASSLQSNGGQGVGNDWAYFGAFANSNTGLTPAQAQGGTFNLVPPPSPSGNDIRITGYGTDNTPSTHNQVQQTHVGPLVTSTTTRVQYVTDTTGGNSGSPVIWEQTGQAVGIHTHGGCGDTGGQNSGTASTHPGLQAAMAAPQGICAAGFEFVQTPPDLVMPGTVTTLQVRTISAAMNPLFHFRLQGNAFSSVAMTPLGNDVYSASLPAVACGDDPEYYFSYDDVDCGTVTSPEGAPNAFFSIGVGVAVESLSDDFETDLGWTTSIGSASTGQWQRGVPVNDPNWVYDPTSDSDGSGSCWLTQNELGNTDIDGGSVSLISPVIDLSVAGSFVSYDYFLNLTVSDGVDRLLVQARNGLASWRTVTEHTETGGLQWRTQLLTTGDFLSAGVLLGNDVQLRFTANDSGTSSIVEAGLDAFFVGSVDCGLGTNYCVSGANGATIGVAGSVSFAANDLVLTSAGVPPNVNGLFFYGDLQTTVLLGNGLRCVDGSSGIFRLQPVTSSGPGGVISHSLDVLAPPLPGGQISPGSTWNFQLWFRDGASSDLTDAISITFTP